MLCRVMYKTNVCLIIRGYVLIWKASQYLGSRERICILCCDSPLLPYSSLLLTICFRPDWLVIRTTPLSLSQYHSPYRHFIVWLVPTFWQGNITRGSHFGFSSWREFSIFPQNFLPVHSSDLANWIRLHDLWILPQIESSIHDDRNKTQLVCHFGLCPWRVLYQSGVLPHRVWARLNLIHQLVLALTAAWRIIPNWRAVVALQQQRLIFQ